jgi:hypothetical protein
VSAPSPGRGLGRPALFLFLIRLGLVLAAILVSQPSFSAQVTPKYLYSLSSFSGPLRHDGVRLHVDAARGETFLLYQNIVRIFNQSGMEMFAFGENLDVGQIVDLAVDENGDILLLSYKDSRSRVTRCDFRGQPIGAFEIRNLPDGVAFSANRVVRRNGLLYFASLGTVSVIVTDATGTFRRHIEFLPLLEQDERRTNGAEMNGFAVEHDGAILFTVPVLFKVFRYTTDGTLTWFGRSGSGAGRFGVIAGIVVDSQGYLLVADKLKCVVMIFDKDFNFIREFGYRGGSPQNLIVPNDIAVDGRDRVYVAQGRRRGVSVFALERP